MTDYLNLNEEVETPQVTVVARGITKSSANTQGPAFITFLRSVAVEAGFGNKIAVKVDGVVITQESLKQDDFAGQTLTVESYNSAA